MAHLDEVGKADTGNRILRIYTNVGALDKMVSMVLWHRPTDIRNDIPSKHAFRKVELKAVLHRPRRLVHEVVGKHAYGVRGD